MQGRVLYKVFKRGCSKFMNKRRFHFEALHSFMQVQSALVRPELHNFCKLSCLISQLYPCLAVTTNHKLLEIQLIQTNHSRELYMVYALV